MTPAVWPNAENPLAEPGHGQAERSAGRPALSCLETPVISSDAPHWRESTENRPKRSQVIVPPILFLESDALDVPEPSDGDTSQAHQVAQKLRERILKRLDDEEAEDLVEKLSRCGQPLRLHCTSCGRIHESETRCSLKWCPVCARKRAARLSGKYRKASALMTWPMHITLTRANTATISKEQIDELKKAFTKLRERAIWRDNVVGGIKALEMTNTGKGWHPHLHILADCKWLSKQVPEPQGWHSRARKKELFQQASEELQREWSNCIGQLASSIKVRRCDGATAVTEVLKYTMKGGDLADSPDEIAPAIRAISMGRVVSAFGSLYNMRAELKEEEKPSMPCPCCGAAKAWMPEDQVKAIMGASRRDRQA